VFHQPATDLGADEFAAGLAPEGCLVDVDLHWLRFTIQQQFDLLPASVKALIPIFRRDFDPITPTAGVMLTIVPSCHFHSSCPSLSLL
jgi:hypothetical protein